MRKNRENRVVFVLNWKTHVCQSRNIAAVQGSCCACARLGKQQAALLRGHAYLHKRKRQTDFTTFSEEKIKPIEVLLNKNNISSWKTLCGKYVRLVSECSLWFGVFLFVAHHSDRSNQARATHCLWDLTGHVPESRWPSPSMKKHVSVLTNTSFSLIVHLLV